MISDYFFNAAFYGSPIGQYILAPTDKLEILAVNDAFLRSVSRRREDVLGMPLFEVFGDDPNDPDAVGVHALDTSIRAAIATGRSQTMPAQLYPIRMEKEGRVWFEDMFWSATNTPVYDASGRLICVSHTTIDITAQVLAERALRISREEALNNARLAEDERSYLASVLRAAPVGILVVDAGLNILHHNPAHEALYGVSAADRQGPVDLREWTGWYIDGPQVGQMLGPDDWPLAQARAGHSVERRLLRVRTFTAAKTERLLLVSAAPVLDGQGELVGAVAVSIDVEARIRAEDALKEADRRKDEFLAMLAHELRNPLAPIGAAASLLTHDPTNVDHVHRSSEVIGRQVDHMTGLIDELLDVARVTRGLIKLGKDVVDANRVLSEALEQIRPVITERGHGLQVSPSPGPALVEGDHKRLVQVLANLLNNAAKFTPEGGMIRVALVTDPGHVRVSVEDNGVGMTPQLIAHAFDLFAQAERTSDRSQGGLGIGLALVRTLVTLHGGDVSAESPGPGQGARFTVSLPRLNMERTTVAAAPPAALSGGRPLKILMVDDNADGLMMLELLLTALGHQVEATTQPRETMERARKLRPDVCLLDIGLPEIDGLTLAGMLHADPLTRDAALIAMSGYGQEADRAAALAAGFDRYLVKPVDAAELAAAMGEVARECAAAT